MVKNNNPRNVLQKLLKKEEKFDLIEIYHNLMKTYGYIPFDEFKRMNSFILVDLIQKINRDNRKESDKMRRIKK